MVLKPPSTDTGMGQVKRQPADGSQASHHWSERFQMSKGGEAGGIRVVMNLMGRQQHKVMVSLIQMQMGLGENRTQAVK